MRTSVALGVALALLVAAPAQAAPELTLTASHAREPLLRSQAPNQTLQPAALTLRVANTGADPTDGSAVTVTETLPAGLTALINNPGAGAGPLAASGPGWTCTGGATSRCTRGDVLAPGAEYPPITITVAVASSAAPTLRRTATVSGGGDPTDGTAGDDVGVVADACPNGWPSGPLNPERANGCTALDDSDTSCTNRVALTFDDGPSYYRPATLAHLRAKGVPATLFDLGMRLEANPQLVRFALAEGHTVLAHSWDHPNLNGIPASVLAFQVTGTAERFDALGAPYSAKVIRAPFLSANAATTAAIAAMGFTVAPGPIITTDWDPARSAQQIATSALNGLRPGAAILLHDGPVDSPAGQATVDAVPLIIDGARARGYCFGVIDQAGRVAAARLTPTADPIPAVSAPVPYVPLAYPSQPPAPWTLVPQPLQLDVAHSPAVFVRGGTGTLTLTVSNPTAGATDGSTTTVSHPLPAGLTSTGAAGAGWTCSGTNTVTCTRADVLAPGTSFPPITIGVRVADTAPAVIATAPRVTGRSGNVWIDTAADRISTGAPVHGQVGATVPATLALTLGAPATFGAFQPGVAREYAATTSATVTSTAGEAALTAAEPGRMTNGAFTLAQPLQVAISPGTWNEPVSNATAAITFTQAIGASEALRTGSYARTVVFTLSTTTP